MTRKCRSVKGSTPRTDADTGTGQQGVHFSMYVPAVFSNVKNKTPGQESQPNFQRVLFLRGNSPHPFHDVYHDFITALCIRVVTVGVVSSVPFPGLIESASLG